MPAHCSRRTVGFRPSFVRHRRTVSILLIAPLLLIGLVGCGGSKAVGNSYLKRIGKTPFDIDSSIHALRPEIVVEPTIGRELYLGVKIGSDGRSTVDISSASFITFDLDGDIIDSLFTDRVDKSGIATSPGSSMTRAGVNWTPPSGIDKEFRLVVILNAPERMWLREVLATLPPPVDAEPIELTLTVDEVDRGLDFLLRAERVTETDGAEYLPSGERFRIEIFDGPTRIWSSSDDQMFTQATTTVEPEEVGDVVTYRTSWQGMRSDGIPVKSGAYTIVATIPAIPHAYTVRKEIRWTAR